MTASSGMDPRTFVPHGDTGEFRALRDVLDAVPGDLEVVTAEGALSLGTQASAAVRLVVTALADGRPVTVAPQEHLVTPHEAAELLQITRRQLDELVELGEIPFRTVGRHHRFLMGDVLAFHRRRGAKDAPESDEASQEPLA